MFLDVADNWKKSSKFVCSYQWLQEKLQEQSLNTYELCHQLCHVTFLVSWNLDRVCKVSCEPGAGFTSLTLPFSSVLLWRNIVCLVESTEWTSLGIVLFPLAHWHQAEMLLEFLWTCHQFNYLIAYRSFFI